MKIGRYFATITLATIMLMLATLVVLVVAVTLVESAGDLTDAEAAATAALELGLYSGIQNAYQVLPIACFIGTLVAGAFLAKRGEILAAQAAGISSGKLMSYFFAVVLLLAVGGGACGEVLVPTAVVQLERVQREELRHTSSLTRFYNRRMHWFREGDLLLYLPVVNPEQQTFPTPVVYRFEEGLISEVIEAELLRHDAGGWVLDEVRVRSASEATVAELDMVRIGLRVRPADLIDVTGDPRQMTSAEVWDLVRRRQKAGFDTTSHEIELHNRFALPLSAVWMFLIVAPWAVHPDRRRSMSVTLGAGVVTIAVLLSVMHLFRLLALGHKIPVSLGAWGAGLVSLAVWPLSLIAYERYRRSGSIF